MVVPFLQFAYRFQDVISGLGVDSNRRFVHDQEPGPVNDRAGDIQSPLHSPENLEGRLWA